MDLGLRSYIPYSYTLRCGSLIRSAGPCCSLSVDTCSPNYRLDEFFPPRQRSRNSHNTLVMRIFWTLRSYRTYFAQLVTEEIKSLLSGHDSDRLLQGPVYGRRIVRLDYVINDCSPAACVISKVELQGCSIRCFPSLFPCRSDYKKKRRPMFHTLMVHFPLPICLAVWDKFL
jgi:hypothetical protein